MIRILNVEPEGFSDMARTILGSLGETVEASLCRPDLLAQLPNFDVLIVRLAHQVDHEIIDAGQRLKAIVSATTGLDHIDLDYARDRGIEVLSLRGETEFLRTVNATAEHAWALLLALLRRIPQAFSGVCSGAWDRNAFRGHELQGKCLGIVGLGRIGRKVAWYGQAFGMDVTAFDPFATNWTDGVKRADSLTDLLCYTDVLTFHVPLNDTTLGMFGAKEIALLPRESVLINTSRGEVIEESSLVQALENKQLAGAALDVIAHEREPELLQQSALLAYARAHDNLILTPHIGGATYESMARTEVFMARKLAAFLESSQIAKCSAQ